MKYYKLLDENNIAPYSEFVWDLSGNWMRVKGELIMCENGYHVLRAENIPYWIHCGFNLFEVEIGDEKIVEKNKICARSVRVIRKIESYNKENVLEFVIKPATKRAQNYTDAARAARDAAYATRDAKYSTLEARYAAYASNFIRDAKYAPSAATHAAVAADYAARAADYAARAARAASSSSSGDDAAAHAASAVDYTVNAAANSAATNAVDYVVNAANARAVERKKQAEDIKKILNMEE